MLEENHTEVVVVDYTVPEGKNKTKLVMVYNQMGYLSTALVNVTFKRKRRKPKQNKITHRCQNYQCHRLHYHCLQRKENRKGNKKYKHRQNKIIDKQLKKYCSL